MELASPHRAVFLAGTGKLFWDVASRALSFAFSILVARELGAAGYGAFAVFWYGAWMLSQATDLGLHLTTLRSLAQSPSSRVLWTAVLAKGMATSLVMIVAGVALPATGPLLLYLLLVHVLSSWVDLAGIVLRSRGLIAREGILLTVLRCSWLLGAVFALRAGADLPHLALVLTISSLPAFAVGALGALATSLVSRQRFGERAHARVARADFLRLSRSVLPLALGSIVTLLYLRIDLLLVSLLRDANEAGLFQSGFRLFEATFVLSGGIASGTFPLLAARLGQPGFHALPRFVLLLLLCISLPLACLLAFGAEPILVVVYGSEFRAASSALAILGLALPAVFINALTTHLLVASGRTRRYVLATLVRLFVALALDVLLVPTLGASGAATAVALAEWSLTGFTLASLAEGLGSSRFQRSIIGPEEASS